MGNHILHTFWTLGLRAAQKVSQSCPGKPLVLQMVTQRCQKAAKMEPESEPKLEHSVQNNIKRLKEKTKKQQPNKKEKV